MDINNYLPNSGHHLEAGVHRAGCAKTPVTTCKNKKFLFLLTIPLSSFQLKTLILPLAASLELAVNKLKTTRLAKKKKKKKKKTGQNLAENLFCNTHIGKLL